MNRYELRVGKFGVYFYDKELKEDMFLESVLRLINVKPNLLKTQRDLLDYCCKPITAKDLAIILETSRSNAGGKLKDLYDKGYLIRQVKKQPKGDSTYEFIYSLNE